MTGEIKDIVFDFGGVLVDWNPRYLYKNVFEDKQEMEYFLTHICTDEWNLEQDRGRTLSEGTRILQKEFPGHHAHIQLFYDQWESMLKSEIHANTSLLPILSEKYDLYGLTNWSSETFPIALERYPFFNLFDGIVVSGEEKMIKPDKKFYQILLDRYKLKSETSLFIDDNIKNIHAAAEMGFDTIHFTPNTNLKSELIERSIL